MTYEPWSTLSTSGGCRVQSEHWVTPVCSTWVDGGLAWQGDQRDETRRLRLVIHKEGIGCTNRFPPALPLFTSQDFRVCGERVSPHLDRNPRVMHQVDVPVRMLRRSYIRGNHKQAVAVRNIHHRRRMLPPAFRTSGREDEDWAAWHRLLPAFTGC